MEFPELGQHCAWKECNMLDFLPVVCHLCQKTFCKLHSSPDSHACPKWSSAKLESPEKKTFEITKYRCQFKDCKKTETVEIICPKCLKNFCMAHRLEADHECQVRPGEYMPKTAQLVEQILANRSSQQQTPSAVKKTTGKNAKTQAKVQLMKIKGKAVGDKQVPVQDRAFFQAMLPPKPGSDAPSGSKCLFVSKKWSLGKAVDNMASHSGLATTKGGQKLRVFKDGDFTSEQQLVNEGKLDDTLEAVIAKEELFNGGNLIFRYV